MQQLKKERFLIGNNKTMFQLSALVYFPNKKQTAILQVKENPKQNKIDLFACFERIK